MRTTICFVFAFYDSINEEKYLFLNNYNIINS